MSNNVVEPFTAMTVWEPEPEMLYTIDQAARFAGMPRRHILLYARSGLIASATESCDYGWFFTAETIRTLRRIESLRALHCCNVSAVRLVLGLMKEIERLRAERGYGG